MKDLSSLLAVTAAAVLLAACAIPTLDNQPVQEATVVQADATQTDSPVEEEAVTIAPAGLQQPPADGVLAFEQTLTGLYASANPSVVFIIIPQVGGGSGFVYSDEGYIVTNNHVVEDGSRYEVVFANGERAFAELVGADVDSDLAVLQVENLPEGVEPLPLADPAETAVGQFVVAIGNPFGEQGSMSLGIISGLGRSLASQRLLETGSSYSLPGVVQTDAPINPGNSGGPLLNLEGEVVGVNSAIATTTGTNSGVGFAIPVAAVRQIVPVLIEAGTYTYPYM
ncbi:MAG: trypsin-like serine protease, partial [Chloroflexi bacterium]|nr:trypsin-like serine protease [Chloroflexota bacterium]